MGNKSINHFVSFSRVKDRQTNRQTKHKNKLWLFEIKHIELNKTCTEETKQNLRRHRRRIGQIKMMRRLEPLNENNKID